MKINNYIKHKNIMSNISIADIVRLLRDIEMSTFQYKHPTMDDDLVAFRDIRDMCKTNRKCPHCGQVLYISDVAGYDYVCPDCEENFYEFETDKL